MSKNKRKKKAYFQCLLDGLENIEECIEVYALSAHAITKLQTEPTLAQIQIIVREPPEEEEEALINNAERLAKKAESQLDKGFPMLKMQTTVALWSFFEACIYDSIITWLVATKFKSINHKLQSLKLPFEQIQGQTLNHRAETLINCFKQEHQRKSILGKFDAIYEAIGWEKSGPKYIDFLRELKEDGLDQKEIMRRLNEFYKVRNLIVHRGGIVDKKFKKECPQRKERLGSKINIQPGDLHIFYHAIEYYMYGIVNRIKDAEAAIKPK